MDLIKSFKNKKIFLFSLSILILLLIPFIFNMIFDSGSYSQFLFIKSNMSVSDWFSFWIAYLSFIITAFLAYGANQLTKQIENNRIEEKANENKSFFEIKTIEVCNDDYGLFEFEVCLNIDVISLTELKIHEAKIEFYDGTDVYLFVKENIKGFRYKLQTDPNNIKVNEIESIQKWLKSNYNMSPNYSEIVFHVNYSYKFENSDETIWTVETFSTIRKARANNQYEPNVELIDTGIKTKKKQ